MPKVAFLIAAWLSLLALVQSGCGRKAWPKPQVPENGIGLIEMTASWDNDEAVIEARTLRPGGKAEASWSVKGVRLYHASFPPDINPCDGCPVEYRDVRDLAAPEEMGKIKVIVKGLARDEIHFFQARVLGEDGSLGHLSARVKLSPITEEK